MNGSAIRTWARERTVPEWVGLVAAAGVFGYVGWDSALWDARLQLLLHLVAIGAIVGLGVLALRGAPLPRTPLDTPILALLAAFALATASAMNHGMSLRAMASITAFALALPIALVALRHRPSWVGVVTSVPVLLLAVPSLVVLLSRRLEWVLAGAPGLPPLRLPGEGTPFGSVAVPPFVIWPAWALAGLIEPPAWRRAVRIGLVAVGIPLTILSGSRSAWLAIGAVAVVGGLPWAWSQRHRLRPRAGSVGRTVLLAAAGLAAVALVAALVLPRLTAVTSLLYRVALWRDTLAAWQTDPILGIGPGFMPYARQAAAADFTFPVRQPHSHNLALGVLGDAGIIGLATAAVLVVVAARVAGPWRSRSSVGRTAGIVLIGVAVGGLFEDLTFLPNFNLLVIALLAVALTDAGAVRWAPVPTTRADGRAAALGTSVIGAVLLTSMVATDAGSIAYRSGIDAVARGDWAAASAWFERSATLDPWHPAVPKALAITASAEGRLSVARAAAQEAVARNPGDGLSWTNRALTCLELGDSVCASDSFDMVVAKASRGPELANAALGYEALGRLDAADDAFRRSLLVQPRTAFALEWPRAPTTLDPLPAEPVVGLNLLVAQWVTTGSADPARFVDPATRALAHAMRGERSEAEAWLTRAMATSPDAAFTWELAAVLNQHWGLPSARAIRIAEVVRGRPLPGRSERSLTPVLTYDIASFRGVPLDGLVPDAERLRVLPPFPWILEELLP